VTEVPFRMLLAYGAPAVGFAFSLFFVQFYFLKFATDVLLLSPLLMGQIFAAAKLWDAISNPLVGSASDRTRSRFGRRAPYLVAALPLFVASFAMLWHAPAALAENALAVWVACGLVLFYSAFALYSVPHAALGAELSTDSHERTRLFGARHIGMTAGMMFAFAAMHFAMNAPDPRAAASHVALPAILAAAAILLVPPLFVRAPQRAQEPSESHLVRALGDVWRNRPARLLLFVYFVEALGTGSVGVMAPYVTEYWLGRPELVAVLPAAYVVSGIASIPLWVMLSRRFGKRDTWLGAMVLAAGSFAGLFAYGGSVPASIGLLVLAGFAMGAGGVLASSILADLIDLDERATGERKEGVYSAAMSFMLKFGTSLATAASGFVLHEAGFVPNAEQSPESVLGIRILFAGFPCLGFLLGAMLFTRFSLGTEPVAQRPISSVT
jgi:GPH family glycoside/pentoside/hexuronide:cation symporter